MNKPLTLGSLFDGSGTFPMMGMLSGIVPVWSSEIEPWFVLAGISHYAKMPIEIKKAVN